MRQLWIFIFCIGLSACQNRSKEQLPYVNQEANLEEQPSSEKLFSVVEDDVSFVPPPAPPAPEEKIGGFQPKLIKTGNLEFESTDLKKTYESVRQATKKHGGYLSNEYSSNYEHRQEQGLSIRVPSQNFDALLADISQGVKYFDVRSINVSDVSEEFVDAEARLKTKKELEQRYLALLQKASKVSEILEIEKQVGDLRAEIEAVEGRLRYLSNQVGYSTLSVKFYRELQVGTSNSGNRFVQALQAGWRGIVEFGLLLIALWPLVLALVLAGYFWRKYRRRSAARKVE
jgi:Domain of unknown function (DUF4349)